MSSKRIVITGMGVLSPIGNDLQSFSNALQTGVNGTDYITYFDTKNTKTKFASELKGFNPGDFLSKKDVRKLDPFVQYAMVVTQQAVEHSKLDLEGINRQRAGVIWSSGIGGLKTIYDELKAFSLSNEQNKLNPFFIPKLIINIAAGQISIKYRLHGPSYSTVSACSSSNHALIDAYNLLQSGTADLMITGGSEAIINEVGIGGFNSCQALSTRNDDPATASRPFDRDRDGFVAGEGAGCLILETLEHAEKRGAEIYAEFVGWGMSSDAFHITAPHPDGIGAYLVMQNALNFANIKPKDIDYINVHGTSTPLGDLQETQAIVKLFGDSLSTLNVSSTKSMTGHLLGAAGIVEAIACIDTIKKKYIPPTINHHNFDEEMDKNLNLTLNKSVSKNVNYILSNSFGFGGHNTSIILKKIN